MRRSCLLLLAAGLPAHAQVACQQSVGPDLAITDIGGIANYPAANGRDAFSVGMTQTGVGDAWINYSATTAAHPVFAQGLFRLRTVNGAVRFEQIGQSWLFHGFCALANGGYCTCTPPPDCSHLGIGCSTSDTASITGSQAVLGPRWQVNPSTGAFPFPQANPPFVGAIARRLQADLADLNTTDQFFVETLAIAADDALSTANTRNNASVRQVVLSGGPTDYTATLTGPTARGLPAIEAWHYLLGNPASLDQIPTGDGYLVLWSQPTAIGGGMWHYEYTLYNRNSDAGVGSFSIPLSDTAALQNVGFHDVDYTDGDGVNGVTRDGTDWTFTRSAGVLTWSTTPYATNPNANALLWGTLYNFRFDTDRPPLWLRTPGAAIGLWKTATTLPPLYTYLPTECYANCDGSNIPPQLNVQDFACFLGIFASREPSANCDGSTVPPVLNVLDFSCFLNKFANGCS